MLVYLSGAVCAVILCGLLNSADYHKMVQIIAEYSRLSTYY